MKTILIITSAVLLSTAVAGQGKSSKLHLSENPNAVMYAMPRTTLKVGVVVEKETIRKGPYARFAQRYLGVVAPLADKELYRISGASITPMEEADPAKVYAVDANDKALSALARNSGDVLTPKEVTQLRSRFGATPSDQTFSFNDIGISPIVSERKMVSHISNDSTHVKVTPDKSQVEEKSLEQMAASAADAIFTLRKRRFDLVTGEAGENVFGAGLDAAIKEIARLEQEYLSLFLGKLSVQQIVKEFDIVPDSAKYNYIVCRFSETGGVLPDSDLSGKPIILELRPEGRAASYALPRRASKDARPMFYYRIADVATCRLLDGKVEIAKDRVPVYQFGTIVDVPVGSLAK